MPTIHLTEISTPTGGYDIYHKEFRWMKIQDIESEMQETMQQAMKVGYNSFLYCRHTGTIHMHKFPDIRAGLVLLDNKPQTVTQQTIF